MLFSFCAVSFAFGQDSLSLNEQKKTLTICKKKKTVKSIEGTKSNTKTNQKEITSVSKETRTTKSNTLSYSKLPSFANAELGLMDIREYQEGKKVEALNFVLIEYRVNQFGRVDSVQIHQSSCSPFEKLVLRKLTKTRFNPAQDMQGNAVDYKMFKHWIVVNHRLYEEDYWENY